MTANGRKQPLNFSDFYGFERPLSGKADIQGSSKIAGNFYSENPNLSGRFTPGSSRSGII